MAQQNQPEQRSQQHAPQTGAQKPPASQADQELEKKNWASQPESEDMSAQADVDMDIEFDEQEMDEDMNVDGDLEPDDESSDARLQ